MEGRYKFSIFSYCEIKKKLFWGELVSLRITIELKNWKLFSEFLWNWTLTVTESWLVKSSSRAVCRTNRWSGCSSPEDFIQKRSKRETNWAVEHDEQDLFFGSNIFWILKHYFLYKSFKSNFSCLVHVIWSLQF